MSTLTAPLPTVVETDRITVEITIHTSRPSIQPDQRAELVLAWGTGPDGHLAGRWQSAAGN